MSTGPRTKSVFLQGNHQRPSEQEAPHSALFYLFQEVSRLASSSSSSSKSSSSSVRSSFRDTPLPPPRGLHETPKQSHKLMGKKKEDNPVNVVAAETTALSEPACRDSNSPWKVLSLINLQCEKLLHRRDGEDSGSGSVAPSAKVNPPSEQEDGSDTGENSVKPASDGHRAGDAREDYNLNPEPDVGSNVHTEPETVHSRYNDGQQQGIKKDSAEQDLLNQSTLSPSHKHKLTSNPSENVENETPSESAPTLDCNANVIVTSHPPADEGVEPTTDTAELQSVQKGQEVPHPHQTPPRWRNKTRRKQPHPSRSVDIGDPDLQGVTFRMGTELDESREQCRLLITSKYSKELFKSVRKPRPRTRSSHKSFKTSSSDEESDLTTAASKCKVCASCCTGKTPMWRDAEDGTPLCNACGIRYKKYRVRCVSCWLIPRKDGNSSSCCRRCGNLVRSTSAQRRDKV